MGGLIRKKEEKKRITKGKGATAGRFDAHDGRTGHARDNKGRRSFVGWNEGEKHGCETTKKVKAAALPWVVWKRWGVAPAEELSHHAS